jgi:adenylosuccinate lyase
MSYDTYTSPLASRNASKQMLELWSPRHKFNTWRRIWLAVAEAQHEMGLPVTKEQVEELRAVVTRLGGITDDEMKAAEKYERELRHDVMAHVHALGDSCPKAKGIIHLGMTSQDVVCNADISTLRESLRLLQAKLYRVITSLCSQAIEHNAIPTLAFTHYQPAQPTTVGRRLAVWAHDLLLVLQRTECQNLKLRGFKGATGTQASWLALLGSHERVDVLAARSIMNFLGSSALSDTAIRGYIDEKLEHQIHLIEKYTKRNNAVEVERAKIRVLELQQTTVASVLQHHVSIELCINELSGPVGQTYPRVIDTFILADLASVAAVLHKIATDIRLLCNRKELDEPFEDKQIGSSAMPYKRNPMRCERICGLTRFVMNLVGNAYDTAATQWLERTLDDSSNRRLSLPEAFLALDGALDLMHNVASGLIIHEAMVRKNLMAELPFMATENILMACVKLGGDRQHYHELIRQHAQAAGMRVKQEGLDNDLLERLQNDKHFWSTTRGGPLREELDWAGVMDPMKYIGRSVEQTQRFIKEVVEPLREQYKDQLAKLEDNAPRV